MHQSARPIRFATAREKEEGGGGRFGAAGVACGAGESERGVSLVSRQSALIIKKMKAIWLLALIAGAASAFVPPTPIMQPPRAAPIRMSTAPRAPSRALGILRAPFTGLAAVWRRCDDFACRVGPPRPIAFIKSLIPKKRPLVQVIANDCTDGIYKVIRQGGERVLVLQPKPAPALCSVEDAVEFM